MKLFGWGIVPLILASAVCLTGCKAKIKKQQEKKIRVTIGHLEKRIYQQRIPIKGTVFPVQYATISAKTEGTLDDLWVDEGTHVKKGAKLFSIDRLKLENAVKVKKEEVAVAKTELSTAEIECKLAIARKEKAKLDMIRADKLIKGKAMATSNYEATEIEWKAAQALVEKSEVAVQYRKAKLVQAETNLQIAIKDLADAKVTAPFDCLITEKIQEQGQYVKAGTNIMKLENISSLEIIAYLSASYHPFIKTGKTVATVSFDGKKCGTLKITYRAETIDPITRTFKIKLLLPKTIKLSSGMLCDLDIVLAESNGYGITESAILQTGNKFFVYTATSELKAKSVEVKKGIIDGEKCEILNPGDLKKAGIIIKGQRFLNEGDKISVAE